MASWRIRISVTSLATTVAALAAAFTGAFDTDAQPIASDRHEPVSVIIGYHTDPGELDEHDIESLSKVKTLGMPGPIR